MKITTKRLIIRPVRESDADDIYEYASNPAVGPSAGWKPHTSMEETRRIMQEVFLNKDHVFAAVRKDDGKLMGTIGLVPDSRRAFDEAKMLGYAFGEPYWGQGYATEAARTLIRYGFERLRLDVVSAYCYPLNKRSRHVLEKCGMAYEGTIRRSQRLFDGKYYDSLCFSILQEEYVRRPY